MGATWYLDIAEETSRGKDDANLAKEAVVGIKIRVSPGHSVHIRGKSAQVAVIAQFAPEVEFTIFQFYVL